MKKSIIIALVLALCLPALAQEKTQQEAQDFCKHEVSVGYGFHPLSSVSFDLESLGYRYQLDKVGAFYGAYTYYFNEYIGLGGTYCFDPRKITYTYHHYNSNPLVANLNESCHSFMGHMKLNCINKQHFVLYFKFDAGVCFWDYHLTEFQPELFAVELPDQHCCFAWQAATGIEVGNERIAGFLQLGVGMEGNYSIGIRYKFKNRAQ
jgi:hypothetical protein